MIKIKQENGSEIFVFKKEYDYGVIIGTPIPIQSGEIYETGLSSHESNNACLAIKSTKELIDEAFRAFRKSEDTDQFAKRFRLVWREFLAGEKKKSSIDDFQKYNDAVFFEVLKNFWFTFANDGYGENEEYVEVRPVYAYNPWSYTTSLTVTGWEKVCSCRWTEFKADFVQALHDLAKI